MKTWRATGMEVPQLKAFDEAIESYMTQRDVPNCALAVARGGRLAFARGYTWADDTDETTQPTSLFRIASCTKPITSIAIYQLVEAVSVNLSLSDRVQPILGLIKPDGSSLAFDAKPLKPETPGRYFNMVQVGQLLRHAGGWNRNVTGDWGEPTFFHDDEVAAAFGKELPVSRMEIARWGAAQQMQFWPGTTGIDPLPYSNFGYSLLGLVVEKLRGTDYISSVRQTIFAPRGITRPRLSMPLERSRAPGEVAYVPSSPRMVPDLTGGETVVPIQYGGENNANFASFGGWVMAAPDYVRLLSSYASGANPPTAIRPRDMLGWFRGMRGGVGCSEHGGGLPGTSTYIGLRDDGCSVALFFNKDAAGDFQWGGVTMKVVDVIHEITSDVGAAGWPSHDLFPSTMTAPLPPGPEKLNVFVTGLDTRIREASWEKNVAGGDWRGWWPVRKGIAKAGAPVSVVSRHPNKIDAFVVPADGGVYTAAWERNSAAERWRGWWRIGTLTIKPSTRVTAVSRHPDRLDVFVVGSDGKIYTAAWARGVGVWKGWWRIGSLTAPAGAPVAAVSRHPDKLDVFVVGNDGRVYTAAWESGVAAGAWRGWWRVLNVTAKPGTAPAVVARDPNKLDAFVVGTDGGVWTAAWAAGVANNAWQGWWRIRSVISVQGESVTAVSRDPNKLDVFVVGANRGVHTAAWELGIADNAWRGWWRIGSLTAPFGAAVSAVSRHPDKLDVFVAGGDTYVHTAAWQQGVANSAWQGWWRILDARMPASVVGAIDRQLS